MVRPLLLFLYIYLFICLQILPAQTDSITNQSSSIIDINSKVLSGLEKQYSSLTAKLNKQSEKLLTKMQQKENKLQSKLTSIDSVKAKELFTDEIKQRYQNLQQKLFDTTTALTKFPLKEYASGMDSMMTSLSFLMNNPNLPTGKLAQLQTLSTKLKSLQKANDIQAFIREREAQLKEQLINTGLGKQLTAINKDVIYYQMQLTEYKNMLNDKERLKEKLLETVRTLPAFQTFWQKNSYLAALFPMQGSEITQSTIGLQTRASMQNFLAQRIGGIQNITNNAPANPQQYIQPGLNEAQGQITQLKNKLSDLTPTLSKGEGVNSDMTMPNGYKPNDQKTRSFFKRLHYGLNFQSEPGQSYLPATSDIALTVGYRLCDEKEVGIGASYKMGWGHGIKDIHLTSEGVGLRSYVDIKSPIKSKGIFFSGLWLTGAVEYNYYSSFKTLRELHYNVAAWQCSGLFGLTKKYKVGKKESCVQVLYDFLHNRQTPQGRAFKFRVGYNF